MESASYMAMSSRVIGGACVFLPNSKLGIQSNLQPITKLTLNLNFRMSFLHKFEKNKIAGRFHDFYGTGYGSPINHLRNSGLPTMAKCWLSVGKTSPKIRQLSWIMLDLPPSDHGNPSYPPQSYPPQK